MNYWASGKSSKNVPGLIVMHLYRVLSYFQATSSGELIDEKKLIGCAQLSVLKEQS
jgi:hypothetical protein